MTPLPMSSARASSVRSSPSLPGSTTRSCTVGSPCSPGGSESTSVVIDVRVRWRSSSNVPDSTTRPARTMLTRSQSASTSDRMWLDSRTVRPRDRSSRITCWNWDSINGSSPDVGSSSSSSSTSAANAATSATFCRLPLE